MAKTSLLNKKKKNERHWKSLHSSTENVHFFRLVLFDLSRTFNIRYSLMDSIDIRFYVHTYEQYWLKKGERLHQLNNLIDLFVQFKLVKDRKKIAQPYFHWYKWVNEWTEQIRQTDPILSMQWGPNCNTYKVVQKSNKPTNQTNQQ